MCIVPELDPESPDGVNALCPCATLQGSDPEALLGLVVYQLGSNGAWLLSILPRMLSSQTVVRCLRLGYEGWQQQILGANAGPRTQQLDACHMQLIGDCNFDEDQQLFASHTDRMLQRSSASCKLCSSQITRPLCYSAVQMLSCLALQTSLGYAQVAPYEETENHLTALDGFQCRAWNSHLLLEEASALRPGRDAV